MKNRVLIITHGIFGIELKKSAEMIMGEREDVEALGLLPDQSIDDLRERAHEIIARNEAEGAHTIVMCDLMGGSPSNVAVSCLSKADCEVLIGVNMPMLIEVIQGLDLDLDGTELANTAIESGKAGVRLLNRANLKG